MFVALGTAASVQSLEFPSGLPQDAIFDRSDYVKQLNDECEVLFKYLYKPAFISKRFKAEIGKQEFCKDMDCKAHLKKMEEELDGEKLCKKMPLVYEGWLKSCLRGTVVEMLIYAVMTSLWDNPKDPNDFFDFMQNLLRYLSQNRN